MHQIRNLVWVDKQKGILDCELLIDNSWLPFTANIQSSKSLGPEIVNLALSGVYGDIPQKTMANNSPQFVQVVSVEKSQFLTTLVELGVVTEDELLDSIQKNQLPQSWQSCFISLPSQQQLLAKISFASEQKVNEFTPWVQLMVMCGIVDQDKLKAALLASI